MNSPDDPISCTATSVLLSHVGAIARDCDAGAIFVYADATDQKPIEVGDDLTDRVVYITKTPAEYEALNSQGHRCVRVPDVRLSRFGQIKIAMFLALSNGTIEKDDVVVCLTGPSRAGAIDTLFITKVQNEFAGLTNVGQHEYLPEGVSAEVVERVVDIATELGSEGREGKPVGALFVVGDAQRVMSLSKQLIMNPFRGYEPHERNVLDPALEETVKELATIDGAFVIEGDGTIATCGAYLKTAIQDEDEYALPRGLGARHHAAAGITAVTNSVAITVSESTGTVTIFAGGKIITELEKLRVGGST